MTDADRALVDRSSDVVKRASRIVHYHGSDGEPTADDAVALILDLAEIVATLVDVVIARTG